MLRVRGLCSDLGFELAAGDAGADAPIRWVHITELPDPTPWLSGGELLLTTGIQLDTPSSQREFVRLLAGHHLAGLGFGTGFDHERLPDALVNEAERLDFPLFEVPYELPFIAITERAFARLVNEQYDVLQRVLAIHKRLERLVLAERGLDELVRAVATAIGGAVVVLGSRAEIVAGQGFQREFPETALESIRAEIELRCGDTVESKRDAVEFAPDHPEIAGRSLVLPIATHGPSTPQAWLAAARDAGGLGDQERLILRQAVTVVALELMRQRAMRDTERRLAGDVLAEALAGALEPHELETRLRPFGLGAEVAVLVFALEGAGSGPVSAAAERTLDRHLADAGVAALVATRERLLCAVVDATEGDPLEVAARARAALAADHAGVRAAASRAAPAAALRRSFHEARCSLEASQLANGSPPVVASYRDLGAFQLLLSLQDDEALRLYCDSVLGPLEDGDGDRGRGLAGEELVRSVEAFIEQNGQWERAARQLYCHRHTLRYRIRRVEELTGRDLSRARDRIELWLALRARELMR